MAGVRPRFIRRFRFCLHYGCGYRFFPDIGSVLVITFPIVLMVESIKIKIRHQIGFHMIHRFGQRFDELVEVFLVKENLVPVIPIVIKTLATLRYGQVVVVATGCPHIEEISPSLTCTYTLAVHALHSFVVVFVRHSCLIFVIS